jgi:NAD(P)-dependent dehydrogenase (short-subunit alcohol dehydrogenase family)
MPKATVLIQGASRGVGLEFVRQLLKRETPTHVIATAQSMSDDRLGELQREHLNSPLHRLDVLQLDVRHQDQFDTFTQQVEQCLNSLKRERGLDMLINCAHICKKISLCLFVLNYLFKGHPSNRVETSLNDVLSIDLNEVYQVNVVGPLLVTKMLLDVLKRGRSSFGSLSPNGAYSSIIVNISAELASITNNNVGGWYAYRLSKCALNMATKNLAIEFGREPSDENSICGLKKDEKPLLCVALSPGVVNTQMMHEYKKLFPKNAHFLTKAQSVKRMLATIEKLSVEDNGKFLDFDGKPMQY